MNEPRSHAEHQPTIFLDHPIVGITTPEFQEFAKAVIKAIARATTKSFRVVGGAIVRAWRFVERKSNEAADIHNRQQASADERYARNWFYIRSAM